MNPYAALLNVITETERERLAFLREVFLREQAPPLWLRYNPGAHTWVFYWAFLLLLGSGCTLHAMAAVSWWTPIASGAGVLAVMVIWRASFQRGWTRWLARYHCAGKCYRDYIATLVRRYHLEK